jgi:thioredoxin 1
VAAGILLVGFVFNLIMDVVKDGSLPQPYRISMIPTQVFFDASGQEVFRHLGPLSEVQVMDRLGLKP